ncbi:MmgE/PrpD family protein [Kitasatospora sp. HPMI-4]|uniref:MmgE/PrpD family protein n=1 Tax=Kitasatospora sp. HPMI-4 TaxID=3448443 RepID=UPI003F1C8706
MPEPAPLVRQLADFALRCQRLGLPEAVERRTALALLDTYGCIAAGASTDPARAVARHLAEDHPGRALRELPRAAAARWLGTAAHAHDYDDAQLPTMVHPSAVAVPTALAHAREAPADQLLRATAVGAEIALRAGAAALDGNDSALFDRGLHMTSLCGTLGAAATAGLLRGLDAERLAHALAIATSLASGLLEANRVGGTVKPFHAGWAAAAGTTAAALAAHGLTGAPTALEGRFGYLNAFIGPHASAEALTEDLGERWHYLATVVKPYPTNGFTHPAVELATRLHAQGVRPDQIDTVHLDLPEPVLRTVAEPPAAKAAPPSGYAARFSAPFTVAVALHGGGGLGIALEDLHDDAVRDPALLALAARVHCRPGGRESAAFPEHLGCTLRARLRDGTVRTLRVADTLGSPARPLTPAQVDAKFTANTAALPAAALAPVRAATALAPHPDGAVALLPALDAAFAAAFTADTMS